MAHKKQKKKGKENEKKKEQRKKKEKTNKKREKKGWDACHVAFVVYAKTSFTAFRLEPHAGFENVSGGYVMEIPGPGAGWESEFSAKVSELLASGFVTGVPESSCARTGTDTCKRPIQLCEGMPLVFSKRCFKLTGCCLEKTVLESLVQLVLLVRLRVTTLPGDRC